jgi:hypothetical protein
LGAFLINVLFACHYASKFITKINFRCVDSFSTRRTTLGFVQVWLEVAAINSSAYLSFGSGGTYIAKH